MNLTHWLLALAFSALAVIAYLGPNIKFAPMAVDNLSWMSEGTSWADRLNAPDDVIDFIRAHPENISIAAHQVSQPQDGFFFQADRKQPLASTMKILVLAEYARQVELEIVDPEELIYLSEVDFFYLPGTDGGAHPRAVKYFRETGWVDFEGRVPLKHLVYAMIRFSDNASTDYVITKLGRDNLEALPALLGLPELDAPLPLSGLFLSWHNHQLESAVEQRLSDYQTMLPTEYANEVYFWTFELLKDKAFLRDEKERLGTEGLGISARDQQRFTNTLAPKGTARGYADLMAHVHAEELISPSVSTLMREYLTWPVEAESIQNQFDILGTKGGALPGTLTATYFAKPKNSDDGVVLSVFYQNLDGAVWSKLVSTGLHQQLELKWLNAEDIPQQIYDDLNGPRP